MNKPLPTKQTILENLIDCLIEMHSADFRGVLLLSNQTQIITSIIKDVTNLGNDILPILHKKYYELEYGPIIDWLRQIGSPSSLQVFVHGYYYGSYDEKLGALHAIGDLQSEESYQKVLFFLVEALENPKFYTSSSIEITTMCQILGKWGDERAVPPLKSVIIHDMVGEYTVKTGIKALAQYQSAHPFLLNLAKENQSLQSTIHEALNQ